MRIKTNLVLNRSKINQFKQGHIWIWLDSNGKNTRKTNNLTNISFMFDVFHSNKLKNLTKLGYIKLDIHYKADATESTYIVGRAGVRRSNPDFVAITVINTILGGRFTGWLNDELRVNSGSSFGARSQFDTNIAGGSFYISTFTNTVTTVEAIDLALKTYSRLWKTGIDSGSLESAKAYVKGQFPPNYETSFDLANLLGNMYVYRFDETFINTFSEQVTQLDTKRAKQIIDKYFPKETCSLL